MFIDVQHGLSNRLRALSSAGAIAQRLGYDLVVIWVPDHHCDARIHDLLIYAGPVIEDADVAALARQAAARVYNYIEIEEGAVFNAPVLPEQNPAATVGDVYVRSAYTLVSPHLRFAAEQRFLRALVPARPVRDLMATVPHPNDVAVHVRMSTGAGFDHLSWEAPDNWPAARHQELVDWRAKSAAPRFVTRLDALVAEGWANRIFLAADMPDTYNLFADRYGARLVTLERAVFDRSAIQLQYALADLILLSAADRFLASTWSSFSDLAQRLARPGRPVEKSGIDF